MLEYSENECGKRAKPVVYLQITIHSEFSGRGIAVGVITDPGFLNWPR
jgi:hypothetical protein